MSSMTYLVLVAGTFLASWGFAAVYRRRRPYDLLAMLLGPLGLALALGAAAAISAPGFP